MNPEQIKATEDALKDWWLETAAHEVQAVAPKAVEYGSRDLIEMGRTLLRVAGREVTDEEAAEAGVWFYVVGKIARWTAAMERGDRVSDDTLLDIGTYVKMAQRLRAVGSWPGPEGQYLVKENGEVKEVSAAEYEQNRFTAIPHRLNSPTLYPAWSNGPVPGDPNAYAPLGRDVEDPCDEPDHTPGNACPADHQQERVQIRLVQHDLGELKPGEEMK